MQNVQKHLQEKEASTEGQGAHEGGFKEVSSPVYNQRQHQMTGCRLNLATVMMGEILVSQLFFTPYLVFNASLCLILLFLKCIVCSKNLFALGDETPPSCSPNILNYISL